MSPSYTICMTSTMLYSMKVVCRQTGLSPHVLRAWERRYGVVQPGRNDSNRRFYTGADLEKLVLLARLTGVGHSISALAQSPVAALRELAASTSPGELPPLPPASEAGKAAGPAPSDAAQFLREAVTAVAALDAATLESVLNRAAARLARQPLLDHLITPLLRQIGDLWQEGQLRIAHEHLASAVIRAFLIHLGSGAQDPQSPTLLVCTPSGQWHELGALMVALTAADQGWRVAYLGPNLPGDEIAAAALQLQVRAVAVSLIYPANDPRIIGELRRLRQVLTETPILVGGQAAPIYSKELQSLGLQLMMDLGSLGRALQALDPRH
jgi:MerR family transcriptional regulator, light-induced transcriptional regulator